MNDTVKLQQQVTQEDSPGRRLFFPIQGSSTGSLAEKEASEHFLLAGDAKPAGLVTAGSSESSENAGPQPLGETSDLVPTEEISERQKPLSLEGSSAQASSTARLPNSFVLTSEVHAAEWWIDDIGTAKKRRISQLERGACLCSPTEVAGLPASAAAPSSVSSQLPASADRLETKGASLSPAGQGITAVCPTLAGSSQTEQGAASDIETLKALVVRLQQENSVLKEALKNRGSTRAPVERSSTPSGPTSCAEPPACNSPPSAAEKLQDKPKFEAEGDRGEEKFKNGRGRAPGAPPLTGSRSGKLRGGPPACSGARASRSDTLDSNLRRWGWCSPEETLSSLRTCCADHLLLEGTCPSDGETSSSSSEGAEVVRSLRDLPKESLEVAWLLDLQSKVQANLNDCQHDQQGESCRSKRDTTFPRNALKAFVEEIGFSVLDVEGEEAQDCLITEDPRLVEWFRRPKTPPREFKNLKPGGIASIGAVAASAPAVREQLSGSGSATKREPTLPPSLRKSLSISLSALRRGCPDRLNFLKRLQAHILECSLNANAIELLVELVPDLTVANDRRQLWLDAREVLEKLAGNIQRPLDDEEAFTQFVFEFGSLHHRLELLSFLNTKHMEAQLSSLLVQVQLKLDCLAMLRRRARRLAGCVKAVANAAAVVSGVTQRPLSGNKTRIQSEEKENKGPCVGADALTSRTRAIASKCGSVPMFRWPLLFQMVGSHCGFSADGSLDRTRSLLKVLAPHIGKTLENSELTLLKRAAQKPLAAVVEQHASLVGGLLLLHQAACRAKSSMDGHALDLERDASKELVQSLAARLLQCCRQQGRQIAVAKDDDDLLLTVIPKLVRCHKAQLETLARLVAQLLREYAAFVSWMGDKSSFLPVQLQTLGTGNKEEQQRGSLSSLPSILASSFTPTIPQRRTTDGKLDAFECLSTFLEKLSRQMEATASRPMRKPLMERRGGAQGHELPVQTCTSAASMLRPSARSPPGRLKQQDPSGAPALSAAGPRHELKVRCIQFPRGGVENAPNHLRDLLSQASASLRPPHKTAHGISARESKASESNGLPLCDASPAFRVLRIGSKEPAPSQSESAANPLRHLSPSQYGISTWSLGEAKEQATGGAMGVVTTPSRAASNAADRSRLQLSATNHAPGFNVSSSTFHLGKSSGQRPGASQRCGSQEAVTSCASPYHTQSVGWVGNPLESSTGSFTSVLFSSNPLSSTVRVFLEDGSTAPNSASCSGGSPELHAGGESQGLSGSEQL
ncbi:hypothetical protein Efla_006935 [Eimeria flavescens]